MEITYVFQEKTQRDLKKRGVRFLSMGKGWLEEEKNTNLVYLTLVKQ